jgi:hypothetical protein
LYDFLINFKTEKNILMKRLLMLLFILSELVSYGQAKIGMSPVFSFTPASAVTPSSTVNFGDSVRFTVYVKNKGNVLFNGTIELYIKRDTIGSTICDSSLYIPLTLAPNDSISRVLTFTPTSGPTSFKSGGNGNTIVVWPVFPYGAYAAVIGDSVRPVVWINDINSVIEFEKNQFKLYPNPVLQELTIKSINNSNYKKITIYDVFARKVKEIAYKEIIDVSDLNSGSYWMIITSEDRSYRVNFMKE